MAHKHKTTNTPEGPKATASDQAETQSTPSGGATLQQILQLINSPVVLAILDCHAGESDDFLGIMINGAVCIYAHSGPEMILRLTRSRVVPGMALLQNTSYTIAPASTGAKDGFILILVDSSGMMQGELHRVLQG